MIIIKNIENNVPNSSYNQVVGRTSTFSLRVDDQCEKSNYTYDGNVSYNDKSYLNFQTEIEGLNLNNVYLSTWISL